MAGQLVTSVCRRAKGVVFVKVLNTNVACDAATPSRRRTSWSVLLRPIVSSIISYQTVSDFALRPSSLVRLSRIQKHVLTFLCKSCLEVSA